MGDAEAPELSIPFPTLPPPPVNPGTYLTAFTADIPTFRIDPKDGGLILNLKIPLEGKYLAMPLTDIRGRRFQIVVYAPGDRKPLVREGVLAVYDMQEKKKHRQADRRWRDVQKLFRGSLRD